MNDDGDQPRILISDRQSMRIAHDGLIALARRCLVAEGLTRCELSVSFVGREEMSELHATYLDEEVPTDVLSFPLDEQDVDEYGVRILGDVVIAPEVAAANNPADPAAELRLLLVHGILHLLGYDHEGEQERAAMWARQDRYTRERVR